MAQHPTPSTCLVAMVKGEGIVAVAGIVRLAYRASVALAFESLGLELCSADTVLSVQLVRLAALLADDGVAVPATSVFAEAILWQYLIALGAVGKALWNIRPLAYILAGRPERCADFELAPMRLAQTPPYRSVGAPPPRAASRALLQARALIFRQRRRWP